MIYKEMFVGGGWVPLYLVGSHGKRNKVILCAVRWCLLHADFPATTTLE